MKDRILSTLKFLIFALVISLSFWVHAQANDFFITSVIRDLPLKSGEKVFKDYYINAGSQNGLRNGAFLSVFRKLTTFDNINSKVLGDTSVKIARLKIIHVDKGVSVARLVQFFDHEKTPLSGYDTIMVGDFIEVAEKQ